MTAGDLVVARATGLADLDLAAGVLARARAAVPGRQLPGSGTALPSAPAAAEGFVEVLADTLRAGFLDLAYLGGTVVGVACWITHLAKRRPLRPREAVDQPPASVLLDVRARLAVFDAIFEVPNTATHDHLVYLGTPAGHGGRDVLGLPLGHRARAADENRRQLYAEVHDPVDLRQFRRLGYGQLRVSRVDVKLPPDPPSFAVRRPAPTPSPAVAGAGLPAQGCGW